MKDYAFGCKSFIDALGFEDVRQALMELDSNWNTWRIASGDHCCDDLAGGRGQRQIINT